MHRIIHITKHRKIQTHKITRYYLKHTNNKIVHESR